MSDPFLIAGPAVISFSGGRTSAYMLWRILQAHGGALPDDVVVCFSNTGRELEATLRFVYDVSAHWGVHIHWLEYRRSLPTKNEIDAWREETAAKTAARLVRARSPEVIEKLRIKLEGLPTRTAPSKQWSEVVAFNSASRNGEPFEAMLASRSMLPNPAMRFCTTELKVRTVERFVTRTLGWKRWASVIGFRADEGRRIDKTKKRKGKNRWVNVHPLAEAGITKLDVLRFWREQPFDLGLAGEWEGNCDGCFMKGVNSILRMFQDHPDRMAWWSRSESKYKGRTIKPDMALFRAGRDKYATLERKAKAQSRIQFGMIEQQMPCTGGGCGI